MSKNNNNQVQALPAGNLPDGWTLSTLGEVSTKPQYGWTTKANHDSGNVKLLRTTDITSGQINWATVPFCTKEPDDLDKYLLKPGDIVISRAGSVGVSYLLTDTDKAVFASYLIRFRPIEPVDKKYVYYYLKSPDYWKAIGKSTLGIAVPNVNATKLAKVKIPIAPEKEQKHIVEEIETQFSRLDEAVENLKRVKANLKRYKASVLKAAVEGKLTEEWRANHQNVESASILLKKIHGLKNKLIKEKFIAKPRSINPIDKNDLPQDLPKSWKWSRLENFVITSVDCPHSTPKYSNDGFICVRTSDFRPGYLDLSNVSYVAEATYKERISRIVPQSGDILYSREGGILGIACIIPDETTLCMGQRMILFRGFSNITAKFLLHTLNSYLIKNRVKVLTGGSASPHLNVGEIRNFLIPVPPEKEQIEIVSEVEQYFSLADEIEGSVEINLIRAERLRQSLLKKAFSGHLVKQNNTVKFAAELSSTINAKG